MSTPEELGILDDLHRALSAFPGYLETLERRQILQILINITQGINMSSDSDTHRGITNLGMAIDITMSALERNRKHDPLSQEELRIILECAAITTGTDPTKLLLIMVMNRVAVFSKEWQSISEFFLQESEFVN